MKPTKTTYRQLERLLLGVAAALLLVFSLSRVTAGAAPGTRMLGSSTEGLFYEVSGLHPDGVVMTVDGQEVSVKEYLYWINYYCDYNRTYLGYLGVTDMDDEIYAGATARTYIAQQAELQALSMVTQNAIIRGWADEAGIALTEADLADMASQRASLVAAAGSEEAYLQWLARMGIDDAFVSDTLTPGYLVDHLYEAYGTPGGSLRPDDAALTDYAAERGIVCGRVVTLSGADAQDSEALAQKRAEAEELAAQIAEAEELTAAFDEAAAALAQEAAPTLYSADDSAALCKALLALREGAFSGVIEDGDAFHLAIRMPLDLDQVAGMLLMDDFETRLLSAEVVYNSEVYDSIDVAAFYDGMLRAQESSAQGAEPAE